VAAGLSADQVRHLAAVYGSRYGRVIALCSAERRLSAPICPHAPDVLAQVVLAVREEMALTLSDVLLRRLGVGLGPCRGLDCAPLVAAEMARLLEWTPARVQAEVAAYEAQIHLGDPPCTSCEL
jgi:glycerol-3-phosphate dehydrogenase